jgi:hypothetical protein
VPPGLPVPPPHAPLGFCAVCAGIYAHARKPPAPAPVLPELHTAVAWSLLPQLGAALPACWLHLSPIDIRPNALLPAPADALPSSAVPLLGGGRL